MKNTQILTTLLVLSLVCFNACEDQNPITEQSHDPVVKKLLNSPEFKSKRSTFESFGQIAPEKAVISSVTFDQKTFNTLMIPIFSDGRIQAFVEIVDLINTKYLPNGATYAMNLV